MCDCGGSTTIGKFGGRVGAKLGGMAGDYISNKGQRLMQWAGLGDYNVNYNSLINSGPEHALQMVADGRGIRIRYREYLGDITTLGDVGAFGSQQYKINPGLFGTFPWLSGVANNWDQWVPLGIIFEFRSTCTDSTTVGQLGKVMMSTDYDPKDAIQNNKRDMLNSAYSNDSRMSDDMAHGIECDPATLNRRVFYTSPNDSFSDGDINDYVMGIFTVATVGGTLPKGTNLGGLWVNYEFWFTKEQVFASIPQKSRISGIWRAPTRDVTIGASNALYGMGLAADDTATLREFDQLRIGGYNNGILISEDTIAFPRSFLGAIIKITLNQGLVVSETWKATYGTGTLTNATAINTVNVNDCIGFSNTFNNGGTGFFQRNSPGALVAFHGYGTSVFQINEENTSTTLSPSLACTWKLTTYMFPTNQEAGDATTLEIEVMSRSEVGLE